MNHIAFRFGPSNALVGIVTRPTATVSQRRRTGVIVLNAGVIHRAGPNRLHAQVAMRLARHGFTVLRFDYSGIGDSDPNPAECSLPERNVLETQAAMDRLTENYGIEKFIAIGLCSGADNAFRVATQDSRIVGLGLLDGYAYATPMSRRLKYIQMGRKMLRREVWSRAIAMLRHGLASANGTLPENETLGLMIKPPRAEVERKLHDLISRGVRLLCVYTPELGVYSYADQFFDFFPSMKMNEHVRVEYFAKADHIFTQKRHQVALSDLLSAWAMETCA